jgi:hypothetical protein
MGRPLNKKYFGNRNLGTGGYEVSGGLSNSQNYADDRIGGEGVAAITGLDGNEGRYTNTVPTVTFSDPSIPGGVTALAGDVHVYALRAYPDPANIGTGYQYGDVLNLNPDGVWSGTQMSFTVTALQTVGVTILDDGSACDVGDKLRYSGSYAGGSWTTPLEILVTGSDAGNITSFTVTQAGVWTGSAAPSTTAGATRTQIAAGSDWNATGAQFNLTSYGVATLAVTQAGDHTEVPGNVSTSVVTAATPSSGRTGAKLFVEYGVSSVEIAEKGSGYINVGDAAVTFSTGDQITAYGTAVLTTDSGGVNNQIDALNDPDNQDNAILIYANTDGSGASLGDIIKQTNARSYKVKNGSAIAICKLVADGTPAEGEAYITATDSGGATYYVTKLTAHKALVYSTGSGTPEFDDGTSVKWTFDSAESGYSVTVENA